MKNYGIFYAGGSKITTIKANSITKACENFMEQFNKPYKIEKHSCDYASISFFENYSICSDYVVILE